MTETVFSQPTQVEQSVPVVSLPPEVTEFVGAGKKYASVDDALKSVPHAQKHIQTLEQELAQAKIELEKRKTAEELLESIRSGITTVEPTAPVQFDPEKVTQLVTQTLEQREAQRKEQENISTVINSFVSQYGTKEKAEEAYIKLAEENNMSVQMLNKLSATTPAVILKLAGVGKTTPTVSKIQTSVNTETIITPPEQLSARVPKGAKSKDIVQAWRNAGAIIKQKTQGI